MISIIEELKCAELYVVTAECLTLVESSENKFNAAVDLLVNSGEDVDFRWDDWSQKTVLMVASKLGYKQALQTLIDNKASPDMQSKYGYTALMNAADRGDED